MSIIFSHTTAALMWLYSDGSFAQSANERKGTLDELLKRDGCSPYAYDPDDLRLAPDGPIHLLVPNGIRVDQFDAAHNVHRTRRTLPAHAILKLSGLADAFIASPELCFLQVAELFDINTVARLGCELCSAFYRDSFTDDIPPRTPITNVKALRRFLDASNNAPGVSTARKALAFVCEKAKSPREIELHLAMTLPYKHGGSNFKNALVNHRIPLAKRATDLDNRDYFECDFYWKDKKLVIEYDSAYAHKDHAQRARDESKKNALNYMGIRVITVLPGNINTLRGYRAIEKEIAQALGHRIRPRTKGFPQKQANLWRWLFRSSDPNRWLQP